MGKKSETIIKELAKGLEKGICKKIKIKKPFEQRFIEEEELRSPK